MIMKLDAVIMRLIEEALLELMDLTGAEANT